MATASPQAAYIFILNEVKATSYFELTRVRHEGVARMQFLQPVDVLSILSDKRATLKFMAVERHEFEATEPIEEMAIGFGDKTEQPFIIISSDSEDSKADTEVFDPDDMDVIFDRIHKRRLQRTE